VWLSVSKFVSHKAWHKDDGAVAVVVTIMLGIVLSSMAFAVAVGAAHAMQISTHTAAESAALEAARDCQASGSCTVASIKAHLKSLKLAETYGVSSDAIDVTTLSTDTSDSTRTKVTVNLGRSWNLPFASLLWSTTGQNIKSQASATWTTQVSTRLKSDYMPLMINSCLLSKLRTPSSSGYSFYDSRHTCGLNNDPEVFFFGNAGQPKSGSCVISSSQDLSIFDIVKNASGAMPTASCTINKDYWVPFYSVYQTSQTVSVTNYQKTWTFLTTYKSGKNVITVGTQTYTKLCTNSTDGFTATSCTNVDGSPTAAIVCPSGEKCTVTGPTDGTTTPITSQQVQSIPPQAITQGFIKVRLIGIDVPNPAQPDHIFKLQYTSHDIRLLPN